MTIFATSQTTKSAFNGVVAQLDEVVVLTRAGILNESDSDIQQAVAEELGLGAKRIVLDLSQVTRIVGSGDSQICDAFKDASRNGAKLKIVAPLEEGALDKLRLKKYDDVIPTFESLPEAVVSFAELKLVASKA